MARFGVILLMVVLGIMTIASQVDACGLPYQSCCTGGTRCLYGAFCANINGYREPICKGVFSGWEGRKRKRRAAADDSNSLYKVIREFRNKLH